MSESNENEKAAPIISPERARRFARLTRRAAMYRYSPRRVVPTGHGEVLVDYEEAFAFLSRINKDRSREQRITLNHLILKATAQALRNHIFLNYAFDGGHHLHPVDQIDIRAPVDLGDFPQYVVIKNCDKLSLDEICETFNAKLKAIASSKETPIERRLSSFAAPWLLLSIFFFFHRIGRWFLRFRRKAHQRVLAAEREWMGSYLVSNVGTLGAVSGAGVYVPPSISALVIFKVEPQPVVRDGQVVIRRVGNLGVAIDHRFADGGQGVRFLQEIRRNLEEPDCYCAKEPAAPMFPGTMGGVIP